MSWRFFVLILVALYVLSLVGRSLPSSGGGPPGPVNFASEPGRFQFVFTAPPNVWSREMGTVHGKLTFHSAEWQNHDGSRCETVLYTDLPGRPADEQLLATARGAETDGFKIRSESVVAFGPERLTARKVILVNGTRQLGMRMLLVIKNSRLYMVSITGPQAAVENPGEDAQLDTFQLTP